MSEQRTLGSMAYDTKGKVTRRERFLREMDVALRVERAGRRVVHPETGVLAGTGVPAEKDDCLVGRRPVCCTLS